MDAKKLIELRKQAEKAVEDMPDGEIKIKAFEVILNHLLSPGKSELVQDLNMSEKGKSKRTSELAVDDGTIAGRILVLKDEGFMKLPKPIGEIRNELQAHGWHHPVTALSGALMNLVQKRKLRRQKVKMGNKPVWHYTNP